jgi:eukaryotic-like serine/threonine-protein kinase
MNQNSDDAWLIAIGAAVSDGSGVDWQRAERQAASAEQRRVVEGLRRLASVVAAQRQLPPPQETAFEEYERLPAPVETVTHWRHLVLFERIGAGAFGAVYRGWDPVLDRDVAVKLLRVPRDGAVSPLDEARHLARVRHSNVVVVHGADEDAGTAGIWMELIEGQTLAAIVRDRGPMSAREVAGIGLDLCGALSAIHAAGLLHRDIKAQNVMREVGGRIVLMDFSGAQAVRGDSGHVLVSGTPLYMAPELLRGAAPTPATDVYGLGVLLFFLLSGRLPVEGDTVDDLRRAHESGARQRLRDLRPDLPEGMVQAVERAIAAEPARRYRSAGELEQALLHASGAQTAVAAPPPDRVGARPGRPAAAAVVLLAPVVLAAGLLLLRAEPSAPAPVARFQIDAPLLGGSWPRLSPDGRLVVYGAHVAGRVRFWIRPLDRVSGHPLAYGQAVETPFWSPDSQYLGYFEDDKLKKMAVDQGTPQVLADAPRPRGGDWNGTTILFGRDDGIYRVASGGGDAERVTVVDPDLGDYHHGWPRFLPDGRRFLFLVRSGRPGRGGVYVGSLDGDAPRRLMEPHSRVAYVDGQLLYVRDGTLMAHPFDARRAVLHGEAVALAGRILHHRGSDAAFDVSSTGVLIYTLAQGQPSSRLVLYDRGGRELHALTGEGWFGRPRFSPDGQRVVAERVNPEDDNADIWVYGLSPPSAMRLTTHPAPDLHPVWSPDGRQIAFSSRRREVWDVYVKAVDARDDERRLFSTTGDKFVEHWSPDGRFLTWSQRLSGLWLVPLAASERPVQVRASGTAVYWQSEFSPDGRWLAYMSAESGKREVYVEPFPATGSRWQVSTNGGTEPRWRGDGQELLYLDAACVLMAVPVAEGEWRMASPQRLFAVTVPESAGSNYAISPDGSLVVVNTFVSEPVVPPIEVVVNWPSLVRQ